MVNAGALYPGQVFHVVVHDYVQDPADNARVARYVIVRDADLQIAEGEKLDGRVPLSRAREWSKTDTFFFSRRLAEAEATRINAELERRREAARRQAQCP